MAPGIVAGDALAEAVGADSGERLALEMDQVDVAETDQLEIALPDLQAEIGVLEIADQETFIEAADGIEGIASHQHAGRGDRDLVLASRGGDRRFHAGARVLVQVGPPAWLPLKYHAVVLDRAVGIE